MAGTRGRALRAWLVAAPVLIACSIAPSGGLFRQRGYVDVDLYGRYATGLLDGRIPYRDVAVEYPPGAFAVLLPPALAGGDHYRAAFKVLMAVVALGGLWCVARLLVELGASTARLALALGFVAVSPLLLGSVWLNSFDVWPAALTVAALLALVCGLPALGLAALGLAVAAKVYALVLVVPALVYVHARGGARQAARAAAALVTAAAAVTLPFALASPAGAWDSVRVQLERGLHVESAGASLLLAAGRLGLYDAVVVVTTQGARSRDLAGSVPDALAAFSTALVVIAVVAAWLAFARGRADAPRLVMAFAACIAAVLAFGKVLSPQYAEWLLFLVPLAAAASGVAATALAGAAFVLAQLWFHHYDRVYGIEATVWLVVARNFAIAACFGVLLAGLLQRRGSSSVLPP